MDTMDTMDTFWIISVDLSDTPLKFETKNRVPLFAPITLFLALWQELFGQKAGSVFRFQTKST